VSSSAGIVKLFCVIKGAGDRHFMTRLNGSMQAFPSACHLR
jgi:hypothetical protein